VGERRPGEVVSSEPSTESEPQPEDRNPESSAPEDSVQESSGDQTASSPDGRKDSGERLVSITLSRNQVDHVVRAALGEGAAPSVSALVAGTGFHCSHARQVLSSRYRALQDNRRLSRSLLAGLLVLSCFPPEGVDMGIKDISEQLDLNTSTVHRYVLTLVAAGLLERDPDTRRYRLLPE
jgi:IclR helix-turn-helix domain